MSFYFLVDILRGLNFGSSMSFRPKDISIPLTNGMSSYEAYGTLFRADLSIELRNNDDALLLLLMVLGDVYSFHSWLSPACLNIARKARLDLHELAASAVQTDCTASLRHTVDSTSQAVYCNPYLATSTLQQYSGAVKLLSTALEKWHASCSVEQPRPTRVLFLLCQLMLFTGPTLLALAHLTRRCDENEALTVTEYDKPHVSEKALQLAWCLGELLEDGCIGENGCPSPLWYPFAAFCVGLIAWSRLQQGASQTQENSTLGPRRLLRLSEASLASMAWPCCQHFSAVLRRLQPAIPTT